MPPNDTKPETAAPEKTTAIATRSDASIARQATREAAFERAFEPNDFGELGRWVEKIEKSGLNPTLDTQSKIYVVLATGRELGFTMMQSMRQIFIVNGRAGLMTAAKNAMIMGSPLIEYFDVTETTNEKCTVKAKRKGSKNEVVVTYTIEDARLAGLASDPARAQRTDPASKKLEDSAQKKLDTWGRYPRKMLMWAATREAADIVAPDIANGLTTVEALQDGVYDTPDGPGRTLTILPEVPAALPPVAALPAVATVQPETATAPVVAKVEPAQPVVAEAPPHDPETGEIKEPERGDAYEEPDPVDDTDRGVALREIAKIIAEAQDIPTIVRAKDAILADATEGFITPEDVKPLIILLLGRCKTASERNRVSEIVVALRGSGKLSQDQITAIRAEFEKAKKNGGAA